MIRPSEWLPQVFGDAEPDYGSFDEATRVMGELLSLHNVVNASVSEEQPAPPPDCVNRHDVLTNLDSDAPISQWSRGFIRGHQWLEELWESYIPEELDEEFAGMLLALSFFASPEIAEAFRKESASEKPLDVLATTIRRIFPKAAARCGDVR